MRKEKSRGPGIDPMIALRHPMSQIPTTQQDKSRNVPFEGRSQILETDRQMLRQSTCTASFVIDFAHPGDVPGNSPARWTDRKRSSEMRRRVVNGRIERTIRVLSRAEVLSRLESWHRMGKGLASTYLFSASTRPYAGVEPPRACAIGTQSSVRSGNRTDGTVGRRS